MERLNLSHSSLELLASCPRRFNFQKILEVGERETTKPTAGGAALHEAWYEYAVTKSRRAAFLKLILSYPPEYMLKAGDKWSLQACYSTLSEMLDFPLFDEYEIATINGKPAIEVPFEISLPHTHLDFENKVKIFYVGFIDAIVYHRKTDTYQVLDIKNTARWSDNYEAFHRFSDQLIPYGLALQAVTGRNTREYEVLYLQSVVDLKEPLVNMFSIPITMEDRLPSFIVALESAITSIRYYTEMDIFPRRGSNCVSYSKLCPFYSYCEDNNETILQTLNKREDHFNKYIEKAIKVELQ